MAKRIVPEQCCGVVIDVQRFFLAQVERRRRAALTANIGNLVRLFGHFKIPVIATVERPLERKGPMPAEIARHLGDRAQTFEKDFFDLTKERTIRTHLGRLKRKQVIVSGCETDVCVLQSCLGLLSLGYEVYVVEELLFSSSRNVEAAIARMEAEGAIFLTYKTLYYELVQFVGNPRYESDDFAALPDDLDDVATRRP
jgi:nicotinamidase-related amidase